MKFSFLLGCLLFNSSLTLGADEVLRYHVAFPGRVHHEARITLSMTAPADRELVIAMSRSSPGRYALHEFAKNVYHVTARRPDGEPLEIERSTASRWTVEEHEGEVVFEYTLFAARADGTYSGISEHHAHLNMPATFVWPVGHEERPVELAFTLPPDSGWQVTTQLPPDPGEPGVYRAPDLAYFLDSPVRLAPTSLREWTVSGNGLEQTIALAVFHEGTEEQVDRYADMARKVVAEQVAIFGEPPRFDFGRYTFIASYGPHVHGDGMEHRNSTILTSRSSLENPLRVLGTLSHEFIHAWNVERIRPLSLEPFDFEGPNPCGELWFAEGFTSYYTDLAIVRAGLISEASYVGRIGRPVETILTHPGRHVHSAREMSFQALFVDAATSIDPTNRHNTFISYYTHGAALGLALDLEIRSRFPGLSLDDYMRLLWLVHGKREVPYTVDDLEHLLAVLTSDEEFAGEFFSRHIHGREAPELGRLLGQAGIRLVDVTGGRKGLGPARWEPFPGGGLGLANDPPLGSPLHRARLAAGDVLLELGGSEIGDVEALEKQLETSGDELLPAVFRRGERKIEVKLELAPWPRHRLELLDAENTEPRATPAQLEFRRAWLGSRVGG